jgi:hypothetical protein
MSDLVPKNNFILYNAPSGDVTLNVLLQNETIWLTQKMMAELFDVGVPAINKHLTNIFESNELEENSVISILETTASDGKNYKTKFYNLDAVISVGYRVNSSKATQFRIWATKTLKEYIIKGFVLDDNRLKQGEAVGKFNGNHHNLQREQIRLFNIYVNGKRLNQKEFLEVCLKNNIPHCPLYKETILNHTLLEILKESEIKDLLNPSVDVEGLVWRCVEDNMSFKVINNKYLMKEQ